MAISAGEMACLHNSGSALRMFVKLLLNEKDQEVHESYINCFSGKFLFGANRPFLGPKMARSHNSGSVLRIFCNFCPMTGARVT